MSRLPTSLYVHTCNSKVQCMSECNLLTLFYITIFLSWALSSRLKTSGTNCFWCCYGYCVVASYIVFIVTLIQLQAIGEDLHE